MGREPGKLLASGRDADIYEFGPGLVLRRTKHGRVIELEARVMQFVAERGFPVPVVHDVRAGGTEIVMERLEGPMMMDAMTRRPYKLRSFAALLADLHDQLHEIVAPEWLRDLDDEGGDRLLHLDLHPMNVMMTERGPMVIDWTNASRGDALTDVALTYVLLTCPNAPLPVIVRHAVQPLRLLLARAFVRRYRGEELDARIAYAASFKALTPNLAPDEVESCHRLAARMRARAST